MARPKLSDDTYYSRHKKHCQSIGAAYQKRIREEVFAHYGGDPPSCGCCGETHQTFLTIDHTNGGGEKHRKSLGMRGGYAFLLWLRKQEFPSGYRVLCHNCNQALGAYGYCPHQRKTLFCPPKRQRRVWKEIVASIRAALNTT